MKQRYVFTPGVSGQAYLTVRANSSRTLLTSAKRVMLFVLVTFLLSGEVAEAIDINITANTLWSEITNGSGPGGAPGSGDDIYVSNQAVLTVDVADGICRSISLGAAGQNNSGNLTFVLNSRVNVNGIVAFANHGNRINTITMAAGGELICQGFTAGLGGHSFISGIGTVELTATNTLPEGIITSFNNLTISGGTTTLATNINATGDLTLNANATLDLATFSYGAPTSLTLERGDASGSTITGTGVLTLGSDVSVNYVATGEGTATISCPVELGGTRIFTVADDGTEANDLEVSGAMSGLTFGIIKAGSGTMLLSGINTYTGITTISSGVLKLGAAGDAVNTPLGTAGSGTSVTTGATLDLNGFTPGTSEVLTLNGDGIAGSGALTNSSSTAAVYSGTVDLNSASSIGTTGDINITGVISGANTLTKVGSGTLIVTENNTFSGGIIISAGTIQLGSADRIATQNITFNGGNLSTGATTGYSETLGTITLSAASSLTLGATDHILAFEPSSGVVWGIGPLTIYGWSGSLTGGTEGKIFAGADATGLTAEQLSQITFSGYDPGAQILATGEIIPLNLASPQILISSLNPAVAAGNIVENTTNNVIYSFSLTPSLNVATLSGLQITTGGTYSVTDLANLKAWYSADNIFSPLSDVLLSTKTASLQAVTQIFPNWTNQVLNNGSTGYIFITADITCAASAGSTIYIGPVITTDVTFLSGNVLGSTSAGGVQTFQNATPENVTDFSASVSIAESVLTWTNPVNCYDDILIVAKAISAVTEIPSGDGSAYTGSLVFGSGTAFDGGFVVYKGTESPQTVTGLAYNTTYYFTIFTRKGTIWSSGATTSANSLEAFPGDYRSAASGNWNIATTWERYNGSVWIASLSAPNGSSGNIIIRSGHIVTVAVTVTVDQVLVETGGQVTLNTTGVLTIQDGSGYDFVVKGTFVNTNGTITINAGSSFFFDNGGIYIHNRNGGIVPAAIWDANSNCNVTGLTTTYPTGMNQTFGNVSFNLNSGSIIQMTSSLICQGNLNLANSGSGSLRLTDSNTSRNIFVGGNLIHTSGVFMHSGGIGSGNVNVQGNFQKSGSGTYIIVNSNANSSLTVNGNVDISAGTFIMSQRNGTGTLNVAGNFSHTSGIITETASGRGEILFNGFSQPQVYTSGGTVSDIINFSVNPGAYLQMAASETVITGGGSFILSPDATLGITSTNGITSVDATGNIQVTGTRSYDPGASYVYNGTDPQNTGNGLPVTVNSLTFNNASGAVTLDAAQTITNNFSITIGSVANLGTFTHTAGGLTLGGISQLSGSYGSTISPATNKNDTYFAATAGIVNVLVGCTSGLWIGGTSADWENPLNWCGGELPLPGTDVTIPSSAANMPVISNSPPDNHAVCNNLIIDTGATLTVSEGQALTVTGNLSNSGTLYLRSDASGIASLLVAGTSTGTGINNIELFLTGGGAPLAYKWHYISSPIENNSISDFNGNTLDLARYDESLVKTSQNDGWIASDGYIYKDGSFGSGFSTLSLGSGYAYYFGGDQRYTLTGSINTNAVSGLALSYNAGGSGNPDIIGYNLIGNPFTCTLDWDVVASSNGLPTAGISSAIYSTRDYNLFPTYVPGGPNPGVDGGTNTIPPMQAFFVTVLAEGQSISLPAEAKTHSGTPRFKKGLGYNEVIPMVRLIIADKYDSRDALVWFNEKATLSFDVSFDAYKLNKSLGPINLWFKSGDIDLAINGTSFPETSVVIPVGIHAETAGTYTLYSNEITGLDDYNVTLKDKTTNTTVDLKTGTELTFSTAEGDFEDRFILTINNVITGSETITLPENQFNIYAFSGMLNIELLTDSWSGKKCDIRITDLGGRLCKAINDTELWKNSVLQIPLQNAKGIYIVEIRSGIMKYTGKVVIR